MCQPIDGSILAQHLLGDLGMINNMLLELCWGPREHEQVMSFAGFGFSECPRVDLLYRNEIHDDPGILLLAPFLCQHIHKPLVKLGQKMRPFRDFQRLLTGHSAIGEKEEGTKRGCGRSEFEEIAARGLATCGPDHDSAPFSVTLS